IPCCSLSSMRSTRSAPSPNGDACGIWWSAHVRYSSLGGASTRSSSKQSPIATRRERRKQRGSTLKQCSGRCSTCQNNYFGAELRKVTFGHLASSSRRRNRGPILFRPSAFGALSRPEDRLRHCPCDRLCAIKMLAHCPFGALGVACKDR